MAIQPVSAPPVPTEQEIVVTGNRLSRVQYAGGVNTITGSVRCRITRTSGDPEIDRRMCEIVKVCAKSRPRTRENIEACTAARKREFIATYVPRGRESENAQD
jgi:hypothetical protein